MYGEFRPPLFIGIRGLCTGYPPYSGCPDILGLELCGPVGGGLYPDAALDAREWFLDEEAVIFPLRDAAGPVGG